LDRTAPNLGFVQVKFFQSESTTQFVPVAYVFDQKGKTREDFFLLFPTGYEENSKMYFLTTEDIRTHFEIAEVSGIQKFRIGGSKILNSDKYLVKSSSNTLNRIEHRL
jgi:hypothetical protein